MSDEVSKLKAKLKRSHDDAEKAERLLKNDRAEFEKFKGQEVERISAQHLENVKSFKRERQLWEKQRKAADMLPTRRFLFTKSVTDKILILLEPNCRANRKAGKQKSIACN